MFYIKVGLTALFLFSAAVCLCCIAMAYFVDGD
jgi:hypothetical protein